MRANTRRTLASIAVIALAVLALWFRRSSGGDSSDAQVAASPPRAVDRRPAVANERESPESSEERALALPPTEPEPAPIVPTRTETPDANEMRVEKRTEHGTIWGHVIDERSEPVDGCSLLVVHGLDDPGREIFVELDGSYDLGRLGAGAYELRVERVPFAHLQPIFQGQWLAWKPDLLAPRHFGTEVTVGAPQQSFEVDLTAFNRAEVHGLVTNVPENRKGELRARLQSTEPRLDLLQFETRVDAGGWYAFENVYPGQYRLELLLDVAKDLTGASCPTPFTFELAGGEHRQLPDQEFRAGEAILAGQVRDRGDRPIAGARVLCAADLPMREGAKPCTLENLLQIATTQSDGSFEMRGVTAGPIALFAFEQGEHQRSDPFFAAGGSSVQRSMARADSTRAQDVGVLWLTYLDRPRRARIELDPDFVAGHPLSSVRYACFVPSLDERATASRAPRRRFGRSTEVDSRGYFEFDQHADHWVRCLQVSQGRYAPVCTWLDPCDTAQVRVRYP
jgi:hypothetical protein